MPRCLTEETRSLRAPGTEDTVITPAPYADRDPSDWGDLAFLLNPPSYAKEDATLAHMIKNFDPFQTP